MPSSSPVAIDAAISPRLAVDLPQELRVALQGILPGGLIELLALNKAGIYPLLIYGYYMVIIWLLYGYYMAIIWLTP